MFLRDIDLFKNKIAGLISFVFGLIVIIISFIELNNYNKKPIEFNSIIDSDIKKGLIVEGDIPYNLGKYTYEESSYLVENGYSQNDIQEIVKPYYIIVLDEYKAKEGIFMGIFIMLLGLIFLIIYLKNKSKSWIFIND